MLLEEMIHAFWRDTATLSTTVPLERFFTGPVSNVIVPCVVLVPEQTKTLFHTNRAVPWRKILLRFEIFHESYELGAATARLVEESFDRLLLNAPDDNWSFRFRFVDGSVADSEGVWKFVRRLELTG